MIFERVQALIAEQLNVEKSKITVDTNIMEDLKADSLDVVEMLIAMEDEFGISVPDEDAKDLKTVGKLIEYIESKQNK